VHCTVLYCTVLYCIVLYYTLLSSTLLYCNILYFTVLYCTALYCTVFYCSTMYCTYCTVLYSSVLYFITDNGCQPMFFLFLRRYSFREVLAFSTNSFNFVRFLMQSLQFATFMFVRSLFTSSSHLLLSLLVIWLVRETTHMFLFSGIFIFCSYQIYIYIIYFHNGKCVRENFENKICRSAWKTRGPAITADSLARAPNTAQLINNLQPITAIHTNLHSAVSAGYCS